MDWVFHDSFKTKKAANTVADDIVKLGLACGAKITCRGKRRFPYLLYILPLTKRGIKKD
jgi:hypothetical protein